METKTDDEGSVTTQVETKKKGFFVKIVDLFLRLLMSSFNFLIISVVLIVLSVFVIFTLLVVGATFIFVVALMIIIIFAILFAVIVITVPVACVLLTLMSSFTVGEVKKMKKIWAEI